MKITNKTPQSTITRRSFVKHTAGTILSFGIGASAYGDWNDSTNCALSGFIFPLGNITCGTMGVANNADDQNMAAGFAKKCEAVGGTYPCTIYNKERCATEIGTPKIITCPGGPYWCI